MKTRFKLTVGAALVAVVFGGICIMGCGSDGSGNPGGSVKDL